MRRLWYNGKVVSMDGAMTRYEAVGAEDDKIVFLGTSADALAQSWDEKKDLQGAMVLPGFNDTHLHMLYYAMFQKNVALFGVDLNAAGMNTIVGYVYDMLYGASGGYPSYASAAAIILFVIVLTITCINLLVSRKNEE